MSKHCVLSYALLRYCAFLFDHVPLHAEEEKVFFSDGRGRTHKRDISVSLTSRLGAVPAQKAEKLLRLRAHPCSLIGCPAGQMFSLHGGVGGGGERTQRLRPSPVTKREPT